MSAPGGFVRDVPEHGLRFSWDGYRPVVFVQTRDGRVVDHIDIGGGPGGGPSIGRSRMSFDAVCGTWLHRRGLRPAFDAPRGTAPPAPQRPAGASPPVGRSRRTRLVLAGAAILVVGVLVTVLVLARSDVTDVAVGTWSCSEGADGEPVDVVVGDGTYAIPSEGIRGRWEVTDGRLTTTSEADPRPGSDAGAGYTVPGVPSDLDGPLAETLQVTQQARASLSEDTPEPVPVSYADGRFVYGEGRSAITCVKR